ncbi:hypothetical protein BD289DRAFT_232490 [Coniella lustricola]|uniref:Uncharacterized protein n=1 Tax=Coniella lustricola TaxID=2025994 RepID=A0A2T2ZRR1_9PEZI|nr:hypothetical protein BD289DRAFT_232490 [Coniella lustricola]
MATCSHVPTAGQRLAGNGTWQMSGLLTTFSWQGKRSDPIRTDRMGLHHGSRRRLGQTPRCCRPACCTVPSNDTMMLPCRFPFSPAPRPHDCSIAQYVPLRWMRPIDLPPLWLKWSRNRRAAALAGPFFLCASVCLFSRRSKPASAQPKCRGIRRCWQRGSITGDECALLP